jgi:tRNA threonylcarbamoyl adenosine modification protein (Sua5/YciO/YrdC/YwlC family)
VDEALAVLRGGGVVLLPTDTVYGLAVATVCPGAVEQLFALKGRDRDIPIAVLVADEQQAWGLVAGPVPESARRLAAMWWPGPLTLVVARAPGWSVDIGGDGTTVGVRCPDHPLVRDLCRAVGPLATTSANRHGEPTPVSAREAAAAVGHTGVVIEGGVLAGAASTVVDCTVSPVRVLREGALPAASVEAVAAA